MEFYTMEALEIFGDYMDEVADDLASMDDYSDVVAGWAEELDNSFDPRLGCSPDNL